MRLAWFSPLPPMRTGIADYSAELLPLVARSADVTAFCPSPRGRGRLRHIPDVAVMDPASYEPGAFDATLYHLGNNPWHEFVLDTFLMRPGIAVLHEFVMHHLTSRLEIDLRERPDVYRDLLREEYGPRGETLGALKRFGFHPEQEMFLLPLAGRILTRAQGVVVHSEHARDAVARIEPRVPIEIIPHHAGAPPEEVRDVGVEEARWRLGLPDGFLVGHFGFVTRPKQPEAVVEGFARLRAAVPDARLVLVGSDESRGELDAMLAARELEEAVIRTGYVDELRFHLYLRAVDVVVNLRYPSAGESSGTFARALAAGKPTIVNNYASFAEVPRTATVKVEIDGAQGEELGDRLIELARDPHLRRVIGEGARAYARQVLDPARCRDLYVGFAARVAGTLASARP